MLMWKHNCSNSASFSATNSYSQRKNKTQECFWKLVSKDRFPKVKDFALKMHSMFGSTYVCESTFSTMQQVKYKNRNQMVDETL